MFAESPPCPSNRALLIMLRRNAVNKGDTRAAVRTKKRLSGVLPYPQRKTIRPAPKESTAPLEVVIKADASPMPAARSIHPDARFMTCERPRAANEAMTRTPPT